MAKKQTPKVPTADAVLVVDNEYLPDEVAMVFRAYYQVFLKQGFTPDQSYELTQQMVTFFLWK